MSMRMNRQMDTQMHRNPMKKLLTTLVSTIAVASLLAGCAGAGGVRDADVVSGQESLPEVGTTWAAVEAAVGEVKVGWVDAINDPVLTTLVEEAQRNNRNLQASAASVDQARALARQAGAAVTPSVNLSAGGQRGGPLDGGASTGLSLGLEVGWEADVWGRVSSSRDAAIASAQAAEADYRFAQQSIAAGVARAYLVAIEAQLQSGVTSHIVESLTELNRIVKVQQENGLASQQDVSIARSDLATAKDSAIGANAGERDALRALELLLGRYPGAELEVRDSLPAVPALPGAGLPSELLERRPDLIAADRRIAAAFNSRESAKAARLPRFGLSGTLGGSSNQLSDLLNPANVAWQLGASLVGPLIDGGLGKAQVEQATAEQEAAIAAYADAALTAFGEVETALDQGVVLRDREEALQEAFDEATEALRIAELRFQQGESDLLDVLQVRQRVDGARSTLLSVKRGRLSQFVDANLALGGDFRTGDVTTTSDGDT